MAINEKYSYGSFVDQSFVNVDPSEFNNSEIIGSCFYNQTPYSNVFPQNIENVIFIRCNLDNCNIPPGAALSEGTNKHFKTMNDQEYWIVDAQLNPISPLEPERFERCGLSLDPADIPSEPLEESITVTNDPDVIKQKEIDSLVSDRIQLEAIVQNQSILNTIKNARI